MSSLGSLGLRRSFLLLSAEEEEDDDDEEDFPRLKKERQLPTGDFLDLMGCRFLSEEKHVFTSVDLSNLSMCVYGHVLLMLCLITLDCVFACMCSKYGSEWKSWPLS